MTLDELRETAAFKRRDAAWPSEQWDHTEWDECLQEARRVEETRVMEGDGWRITKCDLPQGEGPGVMVEIMNEDGTIGIVLIGTDEARELARAVTLALYDERVSGILRPRSHDRIKWPSVSESRNSD